MRQESGCDGILRPILHRHGVANRQVGESSGAQHLDAARSSNSSAGPSRTSRASCSSRTGCASRTNRTLRAHCPSGSILSIDAVEPIGSGRTLGSRQSDRTPSSGATGITGEAARTDRTLDSGRSLRTFRTDLTGACGSTLLTAAGGVIGCFATRAAQKQNKRQNRRVDELGHGRLLEREYLLF